MPRTSLAPDTVCLVDRAISEGRAWTFLVVHSADGHWQFRTIDHLDESSPQLIPSTIGRLVTLDSALAATSDLPPGWHAWRQDEDAQWERRESPAGPTFVLEYEVRPGLEHPRAAEIRGAFANCWIRCPSLEQARATALRELQAGSWQIIEHVSESEVSLEDYEGQAEGEQYFRQAQIDGEVFVFHTYLLE